ncbi:MAG: ring-cleaving dioxygenase [Acidobacteriota bacterium]|nr:ring-cleaving dioxygenase [Acidobacteriota bacterium]
MTSNTRPIVGLHHVTAIASNPQRNLDFYTQVLGLRFVKKTVNFDDPGTYHFYFGDDQGRPGTILTFFPWPHAMRGQRGAGEVVETAYSIHPASLAYWQQRLATLGVATHTTERFGEAVLQLEDPDGMPLALIASDLSAGQAEAPRFADVPAQHALRGFHSVTMVQRDADRTAALLAKMGFLEQQREGNRIRYATEGVAAGHQLDIVLDPAANRSRLGAGSVHHIAFRAVDEQDQQEWLALLGREHVVSPVMDRDYFRSIYFREPGGVLFELATDAPGFAIDEPLESLGEQLRVPAWLNSHLQQIEQALPAVTLTKRSTEEVL